MSDFELVYDDEIKTPEKTDFKLEYDEQQPDFSKVRYDDIMDSNDPVNALSTVAKYYFSPLAGKMVRPLYNITGNAVRSAVENKDMVGEYFSNLPKTTIGFGMKLAEDAKSFYGKVKTKQENEKLYGKDENDTISGALPEFGKAVTNEIAVSTPKYISDALYWLGNNMNDPITGEKNEISESVLRLSDTMKNISDYFGDVELIKSDAQPLENGDFSWKQILNVGGHGVGQAITMVGLGRTLGVKPAYGIYAIAGGAENFRESFDKEGDIGKANTTATINAAATYMIDKWLDPLPENIEKGIKLTRREIAIELGKSAAKEPVAETLQQVYAENLARKIGIDPTQDLYEGYIESAIGALFGGVVMGVASGMSYRSDDSYNNAVKRAKELGATDAEISQFERATKAKLEAHPEAFGAVFQKIADENLRNIDAFVEKYGDTEETRKMLQKKTELEEVYNQVNKSLLDSGINEEVANADAKVWQGIALFGAEETGLSPMEYFKNVAPRIERAKYAEFKDRYNKAKSEGKIPQDFNIFQAVVDPKLLKGQKRNPKKTSLLAFIKKQGGLKDVGGDVKSMDAIRQYPALINNKSGRSLDDLAMAAWENGYFPAKVERPEINELLDAIDRELRGEKIYSEYDNLEPDMFEMVDNMKEQLDQLGIDYKNMTAEQVERAYNEAADRYGVPTITDEIDDYIPFQFAGEKAQTAAMDELGRAKQLEADGVDNEEIRQQTGWFKGVDGKWRFEISDKDADFNKGYNVEEWRKNGTVFTGLNFKLETILKHDKLFDAYPFLRKVQVVYTNRLPDGVLGNYDDRHIDLASDMDAKKTLSVLMHEIQHAIQEYEGFARGGNYNTVSEQVNYYKDLIRRYNTSSEVVELENNIDKNEMLNDVINVLEVSEKPEKIIKTGWYQERVFGTPKGKYRKEFIENKARVFFDDIRYKYESQGNVPLDEYLDMIQNGNLTEIKKEQKSVSAKIKRLYKKAFPKEYTQAQEWIDKYDDESISKVELYRRLYGEVEARNTQARINMTEEERKATPPEETQDVKNADAIVVFDDGTTMAYDQKASGNIYYQGGESKILNLTKEFEGYKTAEEIENYLKNIIGLPLNTGTPPLQVQVTEDNIPHIIDTNITLRGKRKQEHLKAVESLEKILKKSTKTGEEPVDLTHNKSQKTIKHKENLEKYVYFEGEIKVGENFYTVRFATEKVKGQNPDLLDLYNIHIKRGTLQDSTVRPSNKNTISPSAQNVKGDIHLQGGENKKDLYATHNMSLAGVREALKMGGLAMPSLAMRKVGQGDINQFGDIVFVANEKMATPSKSNEVYDRDAWTPNLGYAIRYALSQKGRDYIKEVLDRAGQSQQYSMYRYNIEENLDTPKSNDMAIELYHLDKMSKSNEPVNFDRNSDEYLDWYDEHFTANSEPYLWTENDANTDMISRKLTLNNMMKVLRKQERSGGGFIGDYIFDVYKLLNFRSQKFKNLKEIKKNRDKLVSREEQKEALDKLNEEFLALAEDLKKDGEDYSFGDATYGLGLALIQDNDEQIVHWLDYKKLKSDENAVKKVKDFIEKMKNIPTDYFEVKPRRAVEFSEFSGVIIPEGKRYDEVADALAKQHYLNVERVEKGNKAQYEQALRNIQANSETAFFQNEVQTKQPPRGAFYDRVIYLFENADASTIVHEMAHFFLDDMKRFSDNETTKEQLDAIYKYLGSKDGNLTYEQNELFADSFELYMLDGRSPNQLLGKVFARFKRWIGSLWNEVKRIRGIQLTDEIRKTFDEMLGGRSLDFAMQVSGLKMAEGLGQNIPDHVINRAIDYLDKGKMSKSDMEDLLERLKTGELERKDFAKELKKFENNNVINHEALNPFDKVKYRTALQKGNIKKTEIKAKIEKLLDWSKPRSVNGKLVGRFPNLQLNKEFDRIREMMAMPKEEARNKINENIKLIEAIIKGEEVGDANKLAFDNKILSIPAGRASAAMLVDVYGAISDSYNLGRLADSITGEAKRKRKERLIKEAISTLTNDGRVDVGKEKAKIKQILNSFGMSQMSWNGLMDILSMNDKSSKSGGSLLSKMMDVFDAEQKEARGVADDGEAVSKLIGDAIKGTDNSEISVSRYVNTKLKEKFKIEWGMKSKTFTKDQLLDIYMKAKDPETRKMMKEDEILEYNDEFLDAVNNVLTSEDIAVAEALFKFYDQNYAKINAFYEDKYGVSLGKRDFYSPRSIERGGVNVSTGDLSNYAGFSGVKQRKAKAGAIKVKGAFDVLNEYIVNSNHWMAWSDKLLDINAVFGDVKVKNIIRNLFGNDMERRISYEVSRMASNDKFQSVFNNSLVNKIRANYAVSALALKPSLAIKQLTSFPAYWEHMSTPEFIAGVTDFLAHTKEAIELLGNTTLMKTRDVNIIKDFAELSKSELIKNKVNKISLREIMMFNIKFGDRGAIYMGGWALYKSELKKNLAKGMGQEEAQKKALEKFERVTDETQQSGRLSQQSYWQSNPFLRMFTMFQSSQNQYLRKEINAVRGLLTGRADPQKAMKTLFIFHVLLPCFFQWVADGFRWDKDAQLKAGLLGSLNGVFILNTILSNMYDWGESKITGERKRNSSSLMVRDVVPFWGSGEDIGKFFDKMASGDVDWEDYIDVLRAFGKPVGELSGLPVKYPLDVIQNFGNYAEQGEYGKEIELWLGWSPYALRNKE